MTQNFKSGFVMSLALGANAMALSACSTHNDSGSRYGASSASSSCYSECGVYWVDNIVAIPTTRTIETKYVQQPPTIEYVDREVIVEKEVYVERPCTTTQPCPPVGYPEPPTPWTPPPVLRK